MFKFLKTHKLITLLSLLISTLTAAVIISTMAWFTQTNNFTPVDVTSKILTSYFEFGSGTLNDPYCITKPLELYHLSYLQKTNYGFDSNTYFQFGKKGLDSTAPNEYRFYYYDSNGEYHDGEYTNYLNMNYYSGSKALAPIGDASRPFVSKIIGNNMTVTNIHITGRDCADVGIFGYVGNGALISNLFFNGVDIDLADSSLNNQSGNGHEIHTNGYTGYLGGHVYSENNFNNVYVNNCAIRNNAVSNFEIDNSYSFFGHCDVISAPRTGGESFEYSLDGSDVYDYFESKYEGYQGQSLALRNTENNTISAPVNTAISKSGSHYAFDGDKYNDTSASRNYSLGTTGVDKTSDVYELSYYDNVQERYYTTFNNNTNTSFTDVAPSDMKSTGSYMYYDSNNTLGYSSKWIYYTVAQSGESTENTFNCFLLSYTNSSSQTRYLKFQTASSGQQTTWNNYANYDCTSYVGQLSDGAPDDIRLPQVLERNPGESDADYNTRQQAEIDYCKTNFGDYYFVLKTDQSSLGIANIVDGVEASYYLFNPKNNAYVCIDRSGNSTGELSLRGAMSSKFIDATYFSFKGGRKGTIEFIHPDTSLSEENRKCGIVKGQDGIIAIKKITGQTPAPQVTCLGGSQSSESTTVDTYSKVTDPSTQITNNTDIAFVGYHETNQEYYAMSTQQNTNNRGITDAINFANNGTFTNADLSNICKFQVQTYTDGDNDTYLKFYDPSNEGYLASASSSNNYLHTKSSAGYEGCWLISSVSETGDAASYDNGDRYKVQSQSSYTRDTIKFNFGSNLFACYASTNNNGIRFVLLYYVSGTTSDYTYTSYAKALSYTADGGGDYSYTIYPTFYNVIGGDASTRQPLTAAEENISNWIFKDTGGSRVAFVLEKLEGWCLVTKNSQLINGEKYVIAGGNGYDFTAGSPADGTSLSKSTSTFNSEKTKITELGVNTYQFTLESSGTKWKLKTGSDYLNYQNLDSNGNLSISSSGTNNLWNISISSNEALINAATSDSNGSARLQYYSSNNYFRCYASNQQDARLYRWYAPQGDKVFFADEIKQTYNNQYDYSHIDPVGYFESYDSYMSFDAGSYANMQSMATWNSQSEGAGSMFYTTKYVTGGIALIIPNNGSLDFGTLTIELNSSTLPSFMKGGSNCVTLANVGCTDNEGTVSNPVYKLSLNTYNIKQLSYCTLDDNGLIYSAFDSSGNKIFGTSSDFTNVGSFVLVIGCSSGTLEVKNVDIKFQSVIGNTCDFSTVGYRTATYTSGSTADVGNNVDTSTSYVPGQIISFTCDIAANKTFMVQVEYKYNQTDLRYEYIITVYCNANMTMYLFNYDAERAIVKVNGTRYKESYNEIAITATSPSLPATYWTPTYNNGEPIVTH